ncbi:MAG: metallophosphoesterase family protein [Candidatus Micrarchaeia archaeon]
MRVFAVGDLHGDYKSFKKSLEVFDKNKKNKDILIFLGDYADRGENGVEIIIELNEILEKRNDIFALKGNHEDYEEGIPMFSPCDLIEEANKKYPGGWESFWNNVLKPFLKKLKQAFIVEKVLFVHGGISSRIKSKEDLFKKEYEKDLIWSDPFSLEYEDHGYYSFSKEEAERLLKAIDCKLIVRSHQPYKAKDGKPFFELDKKVVTINSSSYYGKPFVLVINAKEANVEKVIPL